MVIDINELEILCNMLIRQLKIEDWTEIHLGDADLYWTVFPSEWTDMTIDPRPAVGSLQDNLNALKKLANQEDRSATYNDFHRLASILNLLSELRNPADPS